MVLLYEIISLPLIRSTEFPQACSHSYLSVLVCPIPLDIDPRRWIPRDLI